MKYFLPLLILGLCLHAQAEPGRYVISPGDGNRIQFESDAPLEKVVGTTQSVRGYIEIDPAAAADNARAEIRVDLTALKTGIDLRDSHMRDNHLETSRFPETTFTLERLSLPAGGLSAGVRTKVDVQGALDLHGVQKPIAPDVYITRMQTGGAERLKIEAAFTVRLADYDIKRPQFLVMKLSEEQRITVELQAVREHVVNAGQ